MSDHDPKCRDGHKRDWLGKGEKKVPNEKVFIKEPLGRGRGLFCQMANGQRPFDIYIQSTQLWL